MDGKLTAKKNILDSQQMRRVIRRMAGEIVERNRGVADLMLVGIRTRGVPLAEALAAEIERMEGKTVPSGTSTSPSTATTSRPSRPTRWSRRTQLPVAPTGASWCSATTCSTPAARCAPRSTR